MERFVIVVNGFQPLTIITNRSILDVSELYLMMSDISSGNAHDLKTGLKKVLLLVCTGLEETIVFLQTIIRLERLVNNIKLGNDRKAS